MKTFTFTVDDNIRFLKELTCDAYEDPFDHPYLAMFKRLHQRFGLHVQLNLFFRTDGFDLSQMTCAYKDHWAHNADWLKFSFHSDHENLWPYTNSGYEEVFSDCARVHEQILRFASEASPAQTTTLHYCSTTEAGVRALQDSGMKGLLGLFGTTEAPQCSYSLPEHIGTKIRAGKMQEQGGMVFAPIDIVLNCFSTEEILHKINRLSDREHLWVMIHEQYFYPDYPAYQPDFEEKLTAAFSALSVLGYESCFFEELIG